MACNFTIEEINSHIIQSGKTKDNKCEYYLMDSMSNYIKYFDPINIMANDLKSKCPDNQGKFRVHSSENDEWAFDRDMTRTEYLRRVEQWDPYPDVIDRIEKGKTQFLSDPKVKEAFRRLTILKKTRKFTVEDGELVIERVMAGDPEYYSKLIRRPKKKGVRILLNFSQNCGQDYTTFANNTVEMFKIAYIFQYMGVPVQIYSGFVPRNATDGREFTGVLFVMKKESEPINLQKYALISCPGFLRYHGFCADALMLENRITFGHGCTEKVNNSFRSLVECDFLIGQENKSKNVLDELLKLC